MTYDPYRFGMVPAFVEWREGKGRMLRISIVESSGQRRLVLEGKLVAPWAAELRTTCDKARADLDGRELVVEIKNLTAINQAGENVLAELLREGIKMRACGVFTKHLLKQLARRVNGNLRR